MQKIGILGGGQLGRMLLQAAANYPVITYVLENDENAPAAHLCHHFTKGNITNYEDVLAFGEDLDAITIEIENVNIDALEVLESKGVRVYPKPSVLRIICNKIRQKEYYQEHKIPSSEFTITHSIAEIIDHKNFLPAVHKLAEGGYDGKGVQIIKTENDFEKGFNAPSVLEKMVAIQKEIAIMIAVNDAGQTAVYPPVEMVFDQDLNLLDYQICPANIDEKVYWKAEAIAIATVKNFKSAGIFAIEMFVTPDGNVLVNETAPRVHNSGHHTIEAHYASQFDMVWRMMLNYPLGNTAPILPSVMLNIIGAEGYSGDAHYDGLDEMLKINHAFFHIYGKAQTKPGRKMGHVTIMHTDKTELLHQAKKIKHHLKVITK